jgi:hypothetical protein
MKKFLSILVTTAFILSLEAQNPHLDYKRAIIISNLSTFETTRWTGNSSLAAHHNEHVSEHMRIFNPVIGYQWKTRKGNFSVLELNEFKWDRSEETILLRNDTVSAPSSFQKRITRQKALGINYEYTMVFFAKRNYSLVPTLGFGANPYFRQNYVYPSGDPFLPEKTSFIGLKTTVTPGLTWYFGERFFAALKIPVCLADLHFTRDKYDNAYIIDDRADVVSSFDITALSPVFSVQAGIGIRF